MTKQLEILVTIPEKSKIFDTFFGEEQKCRLEKIGNIRWNTGSENYTEQQLAEQLEGVDICITGWGTPIFTPFVLSRANNLKLIAHDAGTVRPMVTDEVFSRDIRVCSGNEVFARSVAEGVVAYILTALRRIPWYHEQTMKGNWPGMEGTRGLLDRTVGLIGYGTIAGYLADMLKAFGCKVLVNSAHISDQILQEKGLIRATEEEIFSTCDIVSVHRSLTEKTWHSIGKRQLELMKEGSVFVNTARGAVVKEDELTEVLLHKKISAILDVYETEPLPMASLLRTQENVFLMPHAAGPTEDRRVLVTDYILDDVERFLKGEKMSGEVDGIRAKSMTTQFS